MSYSYTKLSASLMESTVWSESANVRLVWITMLAMADRKGRVWGSVPGLARRARVPERDCVKALHKFLAPDPKSRSKELEGRRITEIDGGWFVVNYEKYRNQRDYENVREYLREQKAKSRKNPTSQEAKQVMSELGFTDRVLGKRIDEALQAQVKKSAQPAEEVAAKMIEAYRAYEDYGRRDMLQFAWSPRKFFSQGFWTSAALWPIKNQPRLM